MDPQERADHLRIFRRELDEVERTGILQLTPEQRARVDAHIAQSLGELSARHDIDTTEPEKQVSLGMRIASVVGGIALCIALALFLDRYLGFWPTWLQVSVLLAFPVIFTIGAEFAARRERTLYYAALLSLVAFAAFVADLVMLGQIFNLSPSPKAFVVWALFGLALAYHFGIRLVLAFGLVALLGWVTAQTNVWNGWWWLEFYHRPEEVLLAGLLLAAVPFLLRQRKNTDFPAVYRLVGMLAFFLAQLYLSVDGSKSYLPGSDSALEHFYQAAGFVTAGVTVWIGIRKNWSGMVNLGTLFFIIFLFARLFEWWWDWMPKYLFFLLIGLVALALVAAFKRLRTGLRSAA